MPPKSSNGVASRGCGTPGKGGYDVERNVAKMLQCDASDLIDALLTKKAHGGSPRPKSTVDTPAKSNIDAVIKSEATPQVTPHALKLADVGGAGKTTPAKRKGSSSTDSPRAGNAQTLDTPKKYSPLPQRPDAFVRHYVAPALLLVCSSMRSPAC